MPEEVTEEVEKPKKVLSAAEQQGFVEIVNADGSKSQVKKEVAKEMVANLESLKESLGE